MCTICYIEYDQFEHLLKSIVLVALSGLVLEVIRRVALYKH
jgi:hypothetical protein